MNLRNDNNETRKQWYEFIDRNLKDTFFPFCTAVCRAGGMSRVIGQVPLRFMNRVTEMVGARRARIRWCGGGRRRMVMNREVAHTRALFDDWSIGESHAEKLHATTTTNTQRASSGVVAVIATVRAPPRHADSQSLEASAPPTVKDKNHRRGCMVWWRQCMLQEIDI